MPSVSLDSLEADVDFADSLPFHNLVVVAVPPLLLVMVVVVVAAVARLELESFVLLFVLPNVDDITSGRTLSLLSTVPVFSALISRSSSIWTSSINLLFVFTDLPPLTSRSFCATFATFATDEDNDADVVVVVVVVIGSFTVSTVAGTVDVDADADDDFAEPFEIDFGVTIVDVPFSVGFGRLFNGHAGV